MNMNFAGARRPSATVRLAGFALLLATAAASVAVAQTADPGSRKTTTTLRIVELALESSGRDLVLPVTDVGTVSVRACETCRPVSLLAGTRSRYQLDGEAVSLPALRTALATLPQASVVVLYARGGTEITRIIATSPPATRR